MIPNKGLSLDVYAVCSQMWKHTESTLSAHLCDIEACGPQVNFELPKEIGEEEKKNDTTEDHKGQESECPATSSVP